MTSLASIPSAPSPSVMSVLYVAGEVDERAAPILRSQLAWACAGPPSDVVVDLSRVTFMSCAGLRPLLEVEGRLGQRLWLRRVPRSVARLLDLTHLRSTFRVLEYPETDDESVETGTPEAQVTGMQKVIRSRAVVEQAKGLLMDVHDCDAEHAGDLLLRVAREGNVEVSDLAAALTRNADAANEATARVTTQATMPDMLQAAHAVDDGARR